MVAPLPFPARSVRLWPLLATTVAVVLGAAGGYLLWERADGPDGAATLRGERTKAELRAANDDRAIEQLEVELAPVRAEAVRTGKALAEVQQIARTWNWFGGNRAQQQANQQRLDEAEARAAEAAAKEKALQQQLQQAKWQRETHQAAVEKIEAQLRDKEAERAAAGASLAGEGSRWTSWALLAVASGLFAVGVTAGWGSRRRRLG